VLAERGGKAAPFRVEVASVERGAVRAASGLTLQTTRSIARLDADIVMVTGFWVSRVREVDALLARADVKRLVRAIAAAYARGSLVASACGGAFLLADAGLLDGRRATTTWWLAEHLKRRRPSIHVEAAAALVADQRVVTGGAVFAQADVALHIVARYAGPALAKQCADALLLDTHASQAPYMARQHLRANDPIVQAAERWLKSHLAEAFEVAKLSRAIGVSPRTLARKLNAALGLSPIALVQRLRVEAAVLLIETTQLSLEEIGARVGYANASTLSRLVRRETRVSPQEFRRRARLA
jgi:transcriptional regulator GlxA family with amidase domain